MRFGLVLNPAGVPSWPGLTDDARAAEEAGFDLVWVGESGESGSAAAVCAGLAPATTALRLVAHLAVGTHPVGLAEEAAVADLVSGGRLVVALGGIGPDDAVEESAAVLGAALAARPFRHAGPRWPVAADPAQPPLRVTPAPVQLDLPIWLYGLSRVPAAVRLGVPFVCGPDDSDDAAAAAWAPVGFGAGTGSARGSRPLLRRLDTDLDGSFDRAGLVAGLRRAQQRWDADTCILQLAEGLAATARRRAIADVGRRVRPRLQLAELPAGLEDHWEGTDQ
ncbi:MAG TPA: LLM class flavin-dependent oxidoreductase [Acidimicrobiia bacterium]|nr:LLM class flavin-dependent oxidoreductase [Acidimicrobiia bacterium]